MSLIALRGRRTRRPITSFIALLTAAALLFAPASPVLACGGSPPPPFCGVSLVLVKAVPGVIPVAPASGPIPTTIPVMVYFGLTGGACPSGPYTVDVDITLTCVDATGAPAPGGGGMITAGMTPGFNFISVPVTILAGPARICTVTGTATTTLVVPVGAQPLGGLPVTGPVTFTATGDARLCIVDEAPDAPGQPRLDMQLVEPASGELQCVSPGGQGRFVYRFTNNDRNASFRGSIRVASKNRSRMPGVSGGDITTAGGGAIAISDPGDGDDFPVAFREGLDVYGCVPLPANPQATVSPEATREISLKPGESKDVEIFMRAWGMCASGSCSEATVVLIGDYSDQTDGFACASFAMGVDSTKAPVYDWPDSCNVLAVNPNPTAIQVAGEYFPGHPVALNVIPSNLQVQVNGSPSSISGFPFNDRLDQDTARYQIQFFNPSGLFEPGDQIQLDYDLTLMQLGSGYTQELTSVVPFSPTGYETLGPSFMINDHIDRANPKQADGWLTLMGQISGRFSELNGVERIYPAHFSDVSITPTQSGPDGSQVQLHVTLVTVAPDTFEPDSNIVLLEVYYDLRGCGQPLVEFTEPAEIIDAILGRSEMPAPPSSALNFNGDSRVDAADYVYWQQNFGTPVGGN